MRSETSWSTTKHNSFTLKVCVHWSLYKPMSVWLDWYIDPAIGKRPGRGKPGPLAMVEIKRSIASSWNQIGSIQHVVSSMCDGRSSELVEQLERFGCCRRCIARFSSGEDSEVYTRKAKVEVLIITISDSNNLIIFLLQYVQCKIL